MGVRILSSRRVRLCLLVTCLAALAAAAAPAGAAELTSDVWYHDGPVARWRIAGQWSFVRDPDDVGKDQGWANAIPSGAQQVQIPNVWNADLSAASFAGTVGWYYARFQPPHDGRYRIRFLSTLDAATAYVDGTEVGSHEGGFLQWETSPVHLDGHSHLLAVRIDNHEDLAPPQLGGRGWWNWGGISREVELREAPDVDVTAVRFGTAALGRRSAVVRAAVTVANATGQSENGRVGISVAGLARQRAVSLAGGAAHTVVFRLRVHHPLRWSPAHPHLYRLDVSTGSGAPTARVWSGLVGVRRFKSRRGILYLNGRRFYARGAAFHDEARNVGAALTPSDLKANLDLLRGLHANFTRSHYPLHPGFLEMLDRAGIVMWGEAPVAWVTSKNLANPRIRNVLLRYLRETIDSQASHASVGMWSGGNELAGEDPRGTGFIGYARAARKLSKSLDPTRPFALAFESRNPGSYAPFCHLLDIVGLNYYLGWYWGPPPGVAHRRTLRANIRPKLKECWTKPWIVTEFGAEAGTAGNRDHRGTYGYQQALIASTLRGLRGLPHINGATIWAGRDFAVVPGWTGGNDFNPRPPFNQKGLVTLSGYRKPAYFTAARLFERLAGGLRARRARTARHHR
jgi:beta-glucuronidase